MIANAVIDNQPEMQKKLEVAISQNDVYRVKFLLVAGCDPNYETTDEYGLPTTYLHLSMDATIIRELLLRGANVGARNGCYQTPLDHAIGVQKENAVVRELLKFQGNLNEEGSNLLNREIRRGHIDIVYEIVNRIDTPYLVQYFERCESNPRSIVRYYAIYENAYLFFLRKMQSIWKEELFQLVYEEDKYIKHAFQTFIFLRRNIYVRKCFKEILEMRSYRICNLLIPDLLKMSTNRTRGLGVFNKRRCFEIKSKFPIYGHIMVTRVKKFMERNRLLEGLDNVEFTQMTAGEENQVHVNRYCLLQIAEFLDNNSLKNFSNALK